MSNIVQKTIYVSLFAQIIAMFISIAGLGIPLSPKDNILRTILGMESFVQIIESIFYTWFGIFSPKSSSKIDIAKYRYYDWFLTTPTMLLSTMMYFQHRNTREIEQFKNNTNHNNVNTTEHKEGSLITEIKKSWNTIKQFFRQHSKSIITILSANAMMLSMGYLRELGYMSVSYSTFIGFMFFGIMFYKLYDDFAKYNTNNYPIYFTMLGLWSLYGIAAMFGPIIKNTSYNILDIFSKNFYSVFIAVYIYLLYIE